MWITFGNDPSNESIHELLLPVKTARRPDTHAAGPPGRLKGYRSTKPSVPIAKAAGLRGGTRQDVGVLHRGANYGPRVCID